MLRKKLMRKKIAPSFGYVAVAIALPVTLAFIGCKRDPNVQKQKYFESGMRYERDGKLKEAVIQFTNALKFDKKYADAHYELAKSYMALSMGNAAYPELLRTVALAPSNVKARIDLGNLQLAGGLLAPAVEQANAVLAVDPNNAEGYALLSNVAVKKGDRAQAKAQIQHALQIDPNRSEFHTALAMLESADSPTSGAAEQELHKAIALDPKAATAHLVLAEMLERKGDVAGAVQQDTAAVQNDPMNLRARISLAGAYLRAGDKAKAEKTLRQATEDFSDTKEGAELLSEYYGNTGQMETAEAAYADLVNKHPSSVALKVAYARILAMRNQIDKMRSLAQELSKKSGNNPGVQILNATLLMKDGKLNEAFNLLQKGSAESPDDVEMQTAFAKVAVLKGDLSTAQDAFQKAIKIAPGNLDALRGVAQIANGRGDGALLSQVANNTIARYPDLADPYLWRGTAEANQKQDAAADADFQIALKKDPNNASALHNLGQLRFRQQRAAEAMPMLQKALEIDPNLVSALNLLVSYDLFQKQPLKAKDRIQQQIAKSPLNANFYGMLAAVDVSTKDFAAARDNAQKAMQLNPSERQFVQSYAESEAALGENDQAIKVWEQWISKHPNDAPAASLLGMAEEAKGDQAKAMDAYRKALQLDTHQALAANNLAYLMAENGQNLDVALSFAQTAREGMPDSPNTADTLAWIYYRKGTYASARDLLEDALKKAPEDTSIHYHLGLAYSKLGDKPKATLHLKRAVALGTNTQIAKDAEAALAQVK